uniref:dUTP diphosphatase n=1 Tax=viral metagenome TaxID=1070528 RepID=A0A6C0HXZ2_9ZZZZ
MSFPVLKITVNNNYLRDLYKNHIIKHNNEIISNNFSNAGFDLFVPTESVVESNASKVTMISMDVKCQLQDNNKPLSYYMYPRSSLSKTPLVLANHVGIIDSGYRGNLIGAFRNLSDYNFVVEKYTRLLQICHPTLSPFVVELVDESELSITDRGEGGFGSTGK